MKKILMMVVVSMIGASAFAVPYTELGDSGDLPGGAQLMTPGSDGLLGNLSSGNDVDMFGFSWDGGLFEAEAISAGFDTQLFLFDNTGVLLFENDDGGVGLLSLISEVLGAGDYFLAVTEFDNDPLNAAGNDIENCVRAGDDSSCGGDLSLASWRGDGGAGGDYEITFNAPVGGGVAVSEPSTLALLGISFLGMAILRRRNAA